VAPRILSDLKVPACFEHIDPAVLAEELHRWNSDN
jgi:hypothetical protein